MGTNHDLIWVYGSELEKVADSADTSVLFFLGLCLFSASASKKYVQFAPNGHTFMLIYPNWTKYAYGYADYVQILASYLVNFIICLNLCDML